VKVSCSRKDLYEGVQTASRAVSSRSSLPILGHLLIRTEDERLRIAATDLELGMECYVESRVVEPGSMTAPARLLVEMLASLPDADVALSSDETDTVVLSCGASQFTIMGLPPEDFPLLPEVVEDTQLSIDAEQMRQGIRKTVFAASADESRAILTGVLMQVTEDSVRFVSTDTHRLCLYDAPVLEARGTVNAIVPGRAMNELLRMLSDADGPIGVTISANQVMFKVGNSVLVSRLIDGQFPNYQKVVPTELDRRWLIPSELFQQAVKRAEIVARDNSHRTTLKTQDGTLSISAENPSGKAMESVEVVRTGEDLRVVFNGRYLMDVMAVIDAEVVEFELNGEVNPSILRPQGQDNYLYVLMPMQPE
jgi:DNA polymerase III subunit beta